MIGLPLSLPSVWNLFLIFTVRIGGTKFSPGQLIAAFSILGNTNLNPAKASWYVPNRFDFQVVSPFNCSSNLHGFISGV